MADRDESNVPFEGKTYSLYGDGQATDEYYSTVRGITDLFLKHCPDKERLLFHIQKAGCRSFIGRLSAGNTDKPLLSFIKQTLQNTLSVYTTGVSKHLRTLPVRKRFDSILSTKEDQYHLYMIEIELVNRMYREAFKHSDYKFALIAHCLRDFRPDCRSDSGEIEALCRHCTEECYIHRGSLLLKRYKIYPYISVSMELKTLFTNIKREHHSVGALGIACVPELANGMRLCIKQGIPAVGIPLDANRCARWMEAASESSYNLNELEKLLT